MTDTTELLTQAAQILAVSPNEAARLCSIGRTTLYAVQKSGRIRVLRNGRPGAVFLDVRSQVSGGGEQGLLGLAFHPGYADNGRFFVYYSAAGAACAGQAGCAQLQAENAHLDAPPGYCRNHRALMSLA